MSHRQRISLCMIVRDEAELLPGCLEAAAGAFDELVVVDTGSRDATVEVARAHGARVLSRPWTDDFSAARNLSLEAATGSWILVLDADERLSPELVGQLRRLTRDDRAGAATVVLRNAYAHGHRRTSRVVRFFRRDASVRFCHRIHEDLSEALARFLARTGRRCVALDGPVEHLGYARSRMTAKDKRARDVRLLRAELAEAPLDLYAWLKLLEHARFWADAALFDEGRAGAVQALERLPPEAVREFRQGGELVALLGSGLPPFARDDLGVVERWFDAVQPSAALHVRRGELRELLGRGGAARADFFAALAWKDAPGDLDLATVRPLLGLARLALEEGELEVARARIAEALGWNPRDPEALVAAAAVARARGGQAEIDAFAERHRAAHGDSVELTAALGDEALAAGELERAVAALTHAAGLCDDAWVHERLGQALLAMGEPTRARAAARLALRDRPAAGLGVLLCDLLEGRDTELELELSYPQASQALRRWVDALCVPRGGAVLEQLAAVASGAEALFPWLSEYVYVSWRRAHAVAA